MTEGAVGSIMFFTRSAILSIGAQLAVAGCADTAEAPAKCIEKVDIACTPAYEPSYDAIYDNLLSRTCGAASTGNVCHFGPSSAEAKGGLALSNRDRSFDGLLGRMGGHARVEPGEPECSILVQRLESDDPKFRMPVGRAALSLAERCAVRQWIANGAPR